MYSLTWHDMTLCNWPIND